MGSETTNVSMGLGYSKKPRLKILLKTYRMAKSKEAS
jgi:hypothetical protein